jgi:hypothetical protein
MVGTVDSPRMVVSVDYRISSIDLLLQRKVGSNFISQDFVQES